MVDLELRKHKQAARAWLVPYTDEQLAGLLAHAQSGRLSYHSCCCLIGTRTANHALQDSRTAADRSHYATARAIPGAADAEVAFLYFGFCKQIKIVDEDALRRRRIIPIIRAEFLKREKTRALKAEVVEAEVVEA